MNATATGTYFDGEVARGRAVTIEFAGPDGLRVAGEGVAETIELSRIRVSDRLGDVPRFIYLPGGAVIETPANDVIDAALAGRRQGRGSVLIHALESRGRIAAVACVLLLGVIAALGFYGPPALARLVARRVPAEVDQKIGAAALATIQPYFSTSSLGEEERARVRAQLARLLPDPAGPRPRIEFRSMNGGLPNAFALPGDVIVVTDELVRLPVSDDELAAVLAHEMGHLARRHGLQSLLRDSFALLIVAAVTGDLATLTSFAGALPITILTAGYSRDLEREADRHALELLRARGIEPRAFVAALVKLEAARESLQRNSTYLSTHPATEERAALFGGMTAAERAAVLAAPVQQRAAAALKRRDFSAAITHCNRLIQLSPTAAAHTLRAKCHLGHGDHALAESDIVHALALDAKLVDAHVTRAEVFALGLRKYDQAIAAARDALALDAECGPAFAILGFAEAKSGDTIAAAPDLDRAIELAGDDYRGWAYRGNLKQRQKDLAGALADYDKALALEPNVEWVRFDRGVLRNAQKKYREALSDFAEVKSASRQTTDYFLQRGLAQQGLGNLALAIPDYQRALEKSPPPALRSILHRNRGAAYAASGQFASALQDFDAVLDLEPKNGAVYYQRAVARRRAGKAAEALADLDRAADLGFELVFIRGERGAARWDVGDYAEARAEFDAILAQKPDAAFYLARGLIEFSLGNWERAETDLEASLALRRRKSGEYGEFFRLLARRRRHGDDQQAAFAAIVATWPNSWAKSVGRYLSGDLTEGALLAQANEGGTPSRNERRCEAYFYIGMTRLLAGEREAAADFFRKCMGTEVFNYYEYKLARAELARRP